MSEPSFDMAVILDGLVLKTDWPEGEITGPTMFGPTVIDVDNGSERGAVRDLTASFDFYSRSAADVDRFTPGVSLFMTLDIYERGSDRRLSVRLFTGVVNEVQANVVQGRPGYIRFHVIATDDKQRVTHDELVNEQFPNHRMQPHSQHPKREITGGVWTLDQMFKYNDTDYMKFRANIAAGNAWNDGAKTTDHFPYRFGMSINDPITDDNPISLMSKMAEIMNLRMFCESGYCGLQAARYRATVPFQISSRFVSSAQGVGMKMYSWTNTWKTRYSRLYSNNVDNTATHYTANDVEKYGTLADSSDYSGHIYEMWEEDNSILWPDVGTYPLSITELNRQRAFVATIQSRRNINEMTVHLSTLREAVSIDSIRDLLGNIFNIDYRLTDDPFIPSVEITGKLPALATSARGIVEKATLTVTPRKNMPAKADLDLTLGAGDGKRGDAQPVGTHRWSDMGTLKWGDPGSNQTWIEA